MGKKIKAEPWLCSVWLKCNKPLIADNKTIHYWLLVACNVYCKQDGAGRWRKRSFFCVSCNLAPVLDHAWLCGNIVKQTLALG